MSVLQIAYGLMTEHGAGILGYAATVMAVILTSVLLYSITIRVRRRAKGDRFDGITVLADPENGEFEYESLHGTGVHRPLNSYH